MAEEGGPGRRRGRGSSQALFGPLAPPIRLLTNGSRTCSVLTAARCRVDTPALTDAPLAMLPQKQWLCPQGQLTLSCY